MRAPDLADQKLRLEQSTPNAFDIVRYPRRDELWLIALDPSKEVEIKKTRLRLVVSRNEMKEPPQTVIAAPITTVSRAYPTGVKVSFRRKNGQLAPNPLRAVDRTRLVSKLGF